MAWRTVSSFASSCWVITVKGFLVRIGTVIAVVVVTAEGAMMIEGTKGVRFVRFGRG
jgi:hypothetical protein